MAEPRVPLYERLPEIYRIRDQEQEPAGQLQAYLRPLEEAFGEIHANVEQLYHDLFIETCEDWAVPYIADLLGSSHLSGDPWTLRADVADTVPLRRRKGTLGAIELLAFNLTRWASHAVELRETLAWQQHLNHQRPDAGGLPPYGQSGVTRHRIVRGGTAALRDPGSLSLIGTPFDRFAHLADFKPPQVGQIRHNLPNLAIFLWRLESYRVGVVDPPFRGQGSIAGPGPGEAGFVARFEAHPRVEESQPLGEPVRLFNSFRFDADRRPLALSELDATPGPIPAARLTSGAPAGKPENFVEVSSYDDTAEPPPFAQGDKGLQFHLPEANFGAETWTFRGANLCAWETGLDRPLGNREIAIDPERGRFAFGLASAAEVTALRNGLRLTYSYGAVGPVGAHPVSRPAAPDEFLGEATLQRRVNAQIPGLTLQAALADLADLNQPLVVTIEDSMNHDLDLVAVSGTSVEAGGRNLMLNRSLILRAASGERPTVRLRRPLRARPARIRAGLGEAQDELDAIMGRLTLRLEGLVLTRAQAFPAAQPLIARAALNRLEIISCTLDPGGFRQFDGLRAPLRRAMELGDPFGFADPADEEVFAQSPEILLQRSVSGALRIDESYGLELSDSLVDAGAGIGETPVEAAITSASDPDDGWGPRTTVRGATFFGPVRVYAITGQGGVFLHRLEVLDHQRGCLKLCYFSGQGDRLPQNHGCVGASEAELRFVSEIFGQPAYGQIALSSDFRILERGPNNDQMGAFGFLAEAHKLRNLQIRFREFMPLGVRPLLIPVT